MPTLHLGVLDVPYATAGTTTGEVATFLEDKYHVMEVFFEDVGAPAIGAALEKSAQDAVDNILLGIAAPGISLTAKAEGEIVDAFRQFLTQQEMDGVVKGVPTRAALKGVNHRRKRPYAKGNPPRPSFIDTGTYESHFRAWVEP